MKDRIKFNDNDAETVYQAIKDFIPEGHIVEVSVSIDAEYFRMSYDGKQVCWDSAYEDAYSIDVAIGWFQEWLREFAN